MHPGVTVQVELGEGRAGALESDLLQACVILSEQLQMPLQARRCSKSASIFVGLGRARQIHLPRAQPEVRPAPGK
jgi:hypothetical protein